MGWRLRHKTVAREASHPCSEALLSSEAKQSIFRKQKIYGILHLDNSVFMEEIMSSGYEIAKEKDIRELFDLQLRAFER